MSFILFYYFVILIQYYFAFLFFFLISGPFYSPPRLDEIIVAVSVPYNFKHYRDSIEYFREALGILGGGLLVLVVAHLLVGAHFSVRIALAFVEVEATVPRQ